MHDNSKWSRTWSSASRSQPKSEEFPSHLPKRRKRLGVGWNPSYGLEHDWVYPAERFKLHPTSKEVKQQSSHLFIRSLARINPKDITTISNFKMNLTLMESSFLSPLTKFERENNIWINVFVFETVLFPIYITKERFNTHVNLLLFSPKGPLVTTVSSRIWINYWTTRTFTKPECFIAFMDSSKKNFYESTNLIAANMVHNSSNSRMKTTPRFSSKITTSNWKYHLSFTPILKV